VNKKSSTAILLRKPDDKLDKCSDDSTFEAILTIKIPHVLGIFAGKAPVPCGLQQNLLFVAVYEA